MVFVPYSFCHRCGTEYSKQEWPRVCLNEQCRLMVWRPINPVAVLIQPVRDLATNGPIGVILGRRGINPHKGVLALPGGFVEFGENPELAAKRELWEEMNIDVRQSPVVYSHGYSDDQGHQLTFFVGQMLDRRDVERCYRSSAECSELVITETPIELAFQSHTEALALYLNTLG